MNNVIAEIVYIADDTMLDASAIVCGILLFGLVYLFIRVRRGR
jgi:hypothetical protein